MPIFDVHSYLEGYVLPGVNQDARQITAAMQARGIDRAVVMSTRAMNADPHAGNRILKAMIDQAPALFGCLVAHLNRVDASLDAIRDMLGSRRIVGVTLVGADPLAPVRRLVADEVLVACRRFQKVVFLQTPNGACVEAALNIASAYSGLRFVFLGMGGEDWRAAIAAAHQMVNVYLETSGVPERAKLPAAVEAIGSHRILFGSATPHVDQAAALGLIADSDIGPVDRRRILYDNAVKLLKLDDGDQA